MKTRILVTILSLCLFAGTASAQTKTTARTSAAKKTTTTKSTSASARTKTSSANTKTSTTKSKTSATKTKTVLAPAKAIDLGLPSGTKWADRNVEAASPEAYGGLYRYGNKGKMGGQGCPTEENIINTKYDVAKNKMGGKWHLPSLEQLMELRDCCSFDFEEVKGIPGYRVTGPNGNSIFLPLTGMMYNYGRSQKNQFGVYPCGERAGFEMFTYGDIYALHLWHPSFSYDISISKSGVGEGFPVRAVQE